MKKRREEVHLLISRLLLQLGVFAWQSWPIHGELSCCHLGEGVVPLSLDGATGQSDIDLTETL